MEDSISERIEKIQVANEFRACAACGYGRGFHSSFVPEGERLRVVFICPSCGARYDLGLFVQPG